MTHGRKTSGNVGSGAGPPGPSDPAWRRNVRRRLVNWFARHARDMPWRHTRDPYCIWISEIMLQQTQVATVIPYYERFLAELPDVSALARAGEDRVLRLWEGLGYYRRARQMHLAAKTIVDEHGGAFPRNKRDVLALPGVGRYTAGAILSIALDAREPILEANSVRVLSRWSAYRGNPASTAGQRHLWALAELMLPRKHVGRFNQALMELGSQVCMPAKPECDGCPAAGYCRAQVDGLWAKIPAPSAKTRYKDVREAAIVIHRNGRVLLRRCGADERWAGLWDFPRFGIDARGGAKLEDEMIEKTRQMTGISVELAGTMATIKHGVTRYRITLSCRAAQYARGSRKPKARSTLQWVAPSRLDSYPLSATGRKIARLLTR